MIHLKPFLEKFESYRLSEIIKYISKIDREKFLNDLKKICSVIDYPISELSDDMFEYLKFKDAYNLQDPVVEKQEDKCEKCNGTGKEKKPWGKEGQKGFHYRNVNCKSCGSTGIKKKTDNKPNHIPTYLKFWFNTNRQYIGITKFSDDVFPSIKNSKISDWEKSKLIKYTEASNLDKVYVSLDTWVMGTMLIVNGYRYLIHNDPKFQGNTPNNTTWRKYGKYSYYLTYQSLHILTPKLKYSSKSPDIFNCPVDSNLDTIEINAREYLNDAEFSLVLNLEKLKSSDHKKVGQIRQSRIDSKSGALHYKKDDEIRKENIDNYISKLSSYDPKGSLNQIKSIIPRFFGWNHPTFFLFYGINSVTLSHIISKLFQIHRGYSEIKTCIEDIKKLIISAYKETSDRYPIIVENIKKCKIQARSEDRKDILEFIDKYEELNKAIVFYLGRDINKIADLESTERKIKSIQDTLKNERYMLVHAKTFLNHLSTKSDPNHPTRDSYLKIKQFIDTNGKDRLLEDMDIITGSIS